MLKATEYTHTFYFTEDEVEIIIDHLTQNMPTKPIERLFSTFVSEAVAEMFYALGRRYEEFYDDDDIAPVSEEGDSISEEPESSVAC